MENCCVNCVEFVCFHLGIELSIPCQQNGISYFDSFLLVVFAISVVYLTIVIILTIFSLYSDNSKYVLKWEYFKNGLSITQFNTRLCYVHNQLICDFCLSSFVQLQLIGFPLADFVSFFSSSSFALNITNRYIHMWHLDTFINHTIYCLQSRRRKK